MQLYKQCKLRYLETSPENEVAWIREEIAHKLQTIKVGDSKKDLRIAIVEEVYNTSRLTADEVGINRRYPLRKATDI